MVLLVVVLAALNIAIGFAVAWLLSDHFPPAKPSPKSPPGPAPEFAAEDPASESHSFDPQQNREFLDHLQQVAAGVEANLQQHTSSVEAASVSLDPKDPSTVLAAANQMIKANQKLQSELDEAREEIKKQKQLIELHAAEARTDPLTEIPNRRALEDELKRLLAQWQRQKVPVSFAMLDVDEFKQFNDTHGHRAGDEVLRGIARVLSVTARDMDVVARYGGEEFAILFPGTQAESAKPAVLRFREAIERAAFDFDGTALNVTASLGLAEALPGATVDSLVKRADVALYQAKENGRNCAYFHNGESCEPIEAGEPVAPATFAPRASDYEVSQAIAPFGNGQFPEPEDYVPVQCTQISGDAFSFITTEKPDYDQLIIRTGDPPNVNFSTARVLTVTDFGSQKEPNYHVRCLTGQRFDPAAGVPEPDGEDASTDRDPAPADTEPAPVST